MSPRALIDTGPMAAYLNQRDHWHAWADEVFARIPGPYLTTESNISEACHILERQAVKGSLALYRLLDTGLIQVASLHENLPEVQAHVAKFQDRRVDFADACLVVLAGRFPRLPIVTTDRADFTVYLRGHSERLVMPPR